MTTAYYGSCFHPRPELLAKLTTVIAREIASLWKRADARRRHDLLTYVLGYLLSFGLGLRVGEVAELPGSAISTTHWMAAVKGKTDRFHEENRWLPAFDQGTEVYRRLCDIDCQLGLATHLQLLTVFNGHSQPAPLTREHLWRQLRRWGEACELGDAALKWHALRHALATYLLCEGTLNFYERSFVLGHAAGLQWLSELTQDEFWMVMERVRTVLTGYVAAQGWPPGKISDLDLA